MNRLTNNNEDKNARTLNPLSHHMCMKNAHTRKAFAVAKIIAIGNTNAGGTPRDGAAAEKATVKIVKRINPQNTPNNNLGATGWQNAGRSSWCSDMITSINQVKQRKQINPDQVDQVPVQTNIIDGPKIVATPLAK
jgi:hypothetical protein